MTRSTRAALLAAAAALATAVPAAAQGNQPLEVGAAAPDFKLPVATSAGVGKAASLTDFRGQTVVLAFFYKARTGG